MPERSDLARAHLRSRLAPLHQTLRAAAARRAALTARLARPDLTPFCVTDDQATLLLDDLEAAPAPDMPAPAPDMPAPGTGVPSSVTGVPSPDSGVPSPTCGVPSPAVGDGERDLRRAAAAAGFGLPLDALAARLRLTRAEQDILLLVAAPDLDASYERIYAYLVDDLNRRLACTELLAVALGEVSRPLAEHGTLRRCGLIRAVPGATSRSSQEYRLADGVLDLLLGWTADVGLVAHDPGEVATPPGWTVPADLDPAVAERLGAGLAAGCLDMAGVWGAAAVQRDAALAVAAAAGRPLRLLAPAVTGGLAAGGPFAAGGPLAESPDDPVGLLAAAARVAAALRAVVWIPADELRGTPAEPAVVDLLARTGIPAVLTGTTPWRPVRLLSCRAYAEAVLPAPDHRQRRAAWAAALPQLDTAVADDLAVRYRMSGDELRAVAAVATTGARFAGNGRPDRIENHLGAALTAVTRGRSTAYARASTPRRTLDDLVLPPGQHRRILEIVAAFRAWPRVAEAWGFGRRAGDTGVKALFTGEPGTGKTLTAEIIAGRLGLDLLKVDLSQLVSKWVGETEKNLETVFRQAEESQSVMFFDEADSLFGKRGDVRHGTDRYANLEVGYLLQRLEASSALVVLASNLQENIDVAFTRRFHFVVNFVRPGPDERLRLWRAAFPQEAPLDPGIDVEALARLDMTGAAIAAAARSAALIAADAGGPAIVMRDVVAGVARQYQREARLLRPADLGRHASLLTAPGA